MWSNTNILGPVLRKNRRLKWLNLVGARCEAFSMDDVTLTESSSLIQSMSLSHEITWTGKCDEQMSRKNYPSPIPMNWSFFFLRWLVQHILNRTWTLLKHSVCSNQSLEKEATHMHFAQRLWCRPLCGNSKRQHSGFSLPQARVRQPKTKILKC